MGVSMNHSCPFVYGTDYFTYQETEGCQTFSGIDYVANITFGGYLLDCTAHESIHLFDNGDCLGTPLHTYFLEPFCAYYPDDQTTYAFACVASK